MLYSSLDNFVLYTKYLGRTRNEPIILCEIFCRYVGPKKYFKKFSNMLINVYISIFCRFSFIDCSGEAKILLKESEWTILEKHSRRILKVVFVNG